MPKAIRVTRTGGPEVLRWEDVIAGDPGPGEARVRHQSVGLNFIDSCHRCALQDVAQSHRDLQARKTTGSTILLP